MRLNEDEQPDDGGDRTKPRWLLFVINTVLGAGAERIEVGLQKLASMDRAQLMQLMSKVEGPVYGHLHNFLNSKPSNIRKLIPIFAKLGEDVIDQLIDEAMGIKDGDEYDEDGDLYYSAGDDDGGGGC